MKFSMKLAGSMVVSAASGYIFMGLTDNHNMSATEWTACACVIGVGLAILYGAGRMQLSDSELNNAQRQIEIEMESESLECGSWAFPVVVCLLLASGLAMIFGSIWAVEVD